MKNIIEIKEEIQIPGTQIILEKGDRIEVLKEQSLEITFRDRDDFETFVDTYESIITVTDRNQSKVYMKQLDSATVANIEDEADRIYGGEDWIDIEYK